MNKLLLKSVIISLLLLLSLSCDSLVLRNNRAPSSVETKNYKRINPANVLFGIEYTFQDREIVNEPGRMTFKTDHKEAKFHEMFNAYKEEMGLTDESIVKNTLNENFKPGYVFNVPNDGNYTINMEPVTIEVNTTPKTIFEIEEASAPIFAAAKKVDLKPYVNPAAERSGMGHIHVGGKRLMDSPLYQNPVLLRNIMAYYHKHPSLLFGFAEAYDIGHGSNIETYHSEDRQIALKKAIDDFDRWYLGEINEGRTPQNGLRKFILLLRENTNRDIDFFHHYRVLNLEHLQLVGLKLPTEEGKFTIEHRSFRPQKDSKTAIANAELLLDLYEKLSNPDLLVPFETISKEQFKRFWSGSVIEDDWKKVKHFINHKNKNSDAMIKETVEALRDARTLSFGSDLEIKLFNAYSRKEDKGKAFELRIESKDERPEITVNDRRLKFERIFVGEKQYWVSYVDALDLGVEPDELLDVDNYRFHNFTRANVTDKDCIRLIESFFNMVF